MSFTQDRFIDLDELVLRCRSPQAKSYVAEAVACYRAGAFRACIVSTWIAVVFDIIDKLRDLAGTGDTVAIAMLHDLDKWRAAEDDPGKKKLLQFEREVITEVAARFELLSLTEQRDLTRLYVDRNSCAHPSLDPWGEPYQPAAEVARAHLRHAVTHLLQHGPVQGKSFLAALGAEIKSGLFPTDVPRAEARLRAQGAARARDVLVKSLTAELAIDVLRARTPADVWPRQCAALGAFLRLHHAVADATLTACVPNVVRGLGDEALPNALYFLCLLPDYWEVLDPTDRSRLASLVQDASGPRAGEVVGYGLEFKPLRDAALARLDGLPPDALATVLVVTDEPGARAAAVRKLRGSDSFITATTTWRTLVAPFLGTFTVAQIALVLEASVRNDQIRCAHEFKKIRPALLDRLSGALAAGTEVETADVWKAVHTHLADEIFRPQADELRTQIEARYPDLPREPAGAEAT